MRKIAFAIGLTAGIFLYCPSFAADEACTLISQSQVSAALEVPVNSGTPIAKPSACQWAGKGKIATLTITQPLGGKTPIDRFNAGKTSSTPGIIVEPVGGVGDDAFYVYFDTKERSGLGLVVKKGSSSFEIRVYGFELDKAKSVAKTLCHAVAGKM
jgi:hypothetical protein